MRILGPIETLLAFWRWLRRMRTALYLLGAIGVATLIATLVPQEPNVFATVAAWRSGQEGPGRAAAEVLHTLGFFDVYGSPWFMALVALLFVSLTSCLIPRFKAFGRMVTRGRPPASRDLASKPHVARFVTDHDPEHVLTVARDLLGRRWRLRPDDARPGEDAPMRADTRGVVVAAPADPSATPPPRGPAVAQVAAERGHLLREGGSLAFHSAFYVLLIAIVLGQLFAFRGQIGVVEGEAFTDTPVAYWSNLAGRWWQDDWHRGFLLTLDRFDVDWTDEGQPTHFISHVTVDPRDGSTPQEADLRVNDPLVVDGMKIHQMDWGYAAHIIVTDQGEVVHDAVIPLRAGPSNTWEGAVKAPAAEPQLGLDLVLVPSAPDGQDGRPVPTGWPRADAPLVLLDVFEGDLQLDRAQGIADLDTDRMRGLGLAALRPGSEVEVREGTVVSFPGLRHWSGFQVSRRPTDPLLLAGAMLLTLALLPALYSYRRRIWVEAVTDPIAGATLVTVGGQAFQRPQAFDDEHRGVADKLHSRLNGRDVVDRAATGDPSDDRQVITR